MDLTPRDQWGNPIENEKPKYWIPWDRTISCDDNAYRGGKCIGPEEAGNTVKDWNELRWYCESSDDPAFIDACYDVLDSDNQLELMVSVGIWWEN